MAIPKKTITRLKKQVPRYQKILARAKARDVNAADTVIIVTDMLQDIFGYDKYTEVTSELCTGGTHCDLAIRQGQTYSYFIAVNAIGIELKEKHAKFAIDQAADQGIQWVILTNGLKWNVYRIRIEQPFNSDLVFTLDFEGIRKKSRKDFEVISMLCRRALRRDAKEKHYQKTRSFNKYVLGNMLMDEDILKLLRRNLRKFTGGVKLDSEELADILENDVLKRDIVEGDDASEAYRRLKRFYKNQK